MVIRKFLKDRVVGPLPFMACLWLINGGDPNCLPTGVSLRLWKGCFCRRSGSFRLVVQKTVATVVVVFLGCFGRCPRFFGVFFFGALKKNVFFLTPEICKMFNKIWISAVAVAGELVSCYKITDSKATSLLMLQNLCNIWQ